MFKYAQIDLTTGKCVGISFLSGEVEAPHMKPLTDEDNVELGDIWDGTTWIPAAEAALSARLAVTEQVATDNSELTQLILEQLTEKGVIV